MREHELIVLRVTWLCQSPISWGKHVEIAKKGTNLASVDIERITKGSSAEGWSAHDRAILKAVEELLDTAMLSDATWAALSKGLNQHQVIELPIIIGHVQGGSYLVNALRIPLQEENKGLAAR